MIIYSNFNHYTFISPNKSVKVLIQMNTLKAMILALGFTSMTASAAIINNVEFPDSFVQAKDKNVEQENISTSATEKN